MLSCTLLLGKFFKIEFQDSKGWVNSEYSLISLKYIFLEKKITDKSKPEEKIN